MRILCITSNYPPHHVGGYEVSCQGVMEGLAARGHEVAVLTSDDRVAGVADVEGEREGPLAVRRELRRYFRDDLLWAPSPRQRWRVERHNQRAIAGALADVAPEVVAVWHVGALSLGVLTAVVEAGVPIVHAVSDDWPSYAVDLDQWNVLLRRLGPVRRVLRPVLVVPTVVGDLGRSGTFCFISESSKARAVAHSPWTFPRTAIVYSGIDRRLHVPAPDRRTWEGRLLYVGRLDPRKGIETAVRALTELPDATLEVQYTGDERIERRRLEGVAADLGVVDRVRFGQVPRADLPARYAAADALVFPSEWEEPLGLVPLEAMASRRPVLATGTGGSGEYLVDGWNCVRFEPGDPSSLAAAVTRLAADGAGREELVRHGEATAAWFDVDLLVDAFEGWYRHAVDPAAAAPPSRHFDPGAFGG